MDKKEFDNFFKPYSKNVDSANKLGFWKLSDALIMQIIKDNIPTDIDGEAVLFDAGGGTGRWVCELSKLYKSKFIIYDRSKDMLKKAEENIGNADIKHRVRLIEGDLTSMENLGPESVDHIISIYNPISFIQKKEKAFGELFRILKRGGKIIIMGQGFCNAVASKINNYHTSVKELEMLDNEQIVSWGKNVPKLNVFLKETMEDGLEQAGFSLSNIYGVPVFTQPGIEDFDPENTKKSKISLALEDEDFFNKVFEFEMKYNRWPSIANRGMNIFAVAIKK